MMKRQKPSWLCKLGLHKWEDYGESVVITWKEPAIIKSPSKLFTQKSKKVFTEKRCLRCGIMMKRILVDNPDGTLSCVGWEPLSESEYKNSRNLG